jgi:hypothetical protein
VAIVVVMIMVIPIMVVTVIIVVPMALIVFPAAVIVVVVRMGPISTFKGRPAPCSGNPRIPAPTPVPVTIDPGITRTRDRRPNFIAQRWRLMTDVDTDLGKGWSRNY